MKQLISLLSIFTLLPLISLGCSCIWGQSVKDAVNRADVIMIGKVMKSEELKIPVDAFQIHLVKYTISVQKLYKGKINSETLEIITGVGNGDCGFPFKEAQDYIIYGKWETKYHNYSQPLEKFLTTDICTRTTSFNQTEVKQIEAFEKPKKF